MKKSHVINNQILILLMARSSFIFSRIFCTFKVKDAVKNSRLTPLWMAEMSVGYIGLGMFSPQRFSLGAPKPALLPQFAIDFYGDHLPGFFCSVMLSLPQAEVKKWEVAEARF